MIAKSLLGKTIALSVPVAPTQQQLHFYGGLGFVCQIKMRAPQAFKCIYKMVVFPVKGFFANTKNLQKGYALTDV
jgi:hypothetical protein